MVTPPAILVFGGSARKESLNKKLAKVAAESATRAGAAVTLVDMRDYPIPLYDGDLEAESGVPETARALRRLMASHQGLIIASPEYNGFITPLLKNTLDWISRPDGQEDGLALYRDKVALVLAASPGGFGGMRSLNLIRQLLANLGVIVLPDQLAIPHAHQAFAANGTLADEKQQASLDRMAGKLVQTLQHLTA
jgi:chromate reductase, NAD(P)H dehydrogenase (quinone)